MSTATHSNPHSNATDASFRLWGKAISDVFAAAGWTLYRTNINWATVLTTSVANTERGYEVWQSADGAGKGLNDFFIRIGYTCGATATTARIGVHVGWAEDGAGNLTGAQVGTSQILQPGASANFSNISVGSGYACWHLDATQTSGSVYSVERIRDVLGAETDELGYFGYATSGTNARILGVVPRVGTVPAVNTGTAVGLRALTASQASYGGNVGVTDMACQKGGWLMPLMNIFFGDTTNFTTGQTDYTFTVYGASHTYRLAANTNVESAKRVLLRYE